MFCRLRRFEFKFAVAVELAFHRQHHGHVQRPLLPSEGNPVNLPFDFRLVAVWSVVEHVPFGFRSVAFTHVHFVRYGGAAVSLVPYGSLFRRFLRSSAGRLRDGDDLGFVDDEGRLRYNP